MPIGRPRNKSVDNIRMCIKETGVNKYDKLDLFGQGLELMESCDCCIKSARFYNLCRNFDRLIGFTTDHEVTGSNPGTFTILDVVRGPSCLERTIR